MATGWNDPLELVPQVPSAWANHVIYGGLLGIAVSVMATGAGVADPWRDGFLFCLAVSFIKKFIDRIYFADPWGVVIGKGFVTALWPFSLWIVRHL